MNIEIILIVLGNHLVLFLKYLESIFHLKYFKKNNFNRKC